MTPFMSSSRNHNNGYSAQVIRESASMLSSENKLVNSVSLQYLQIVAWHWVRCLVWISEYFLLITVVSAIQNTLLIQCISHSNYWFPMSIDLNADHRSHSDASCWYRAYTVNWSSKYRYSITRDLNAACRLRSRWVFLYPSDIFSDKNQRVAN